MYKYAKAASFCNFDIEILKSAIFYTYFYILYRDIPNSVCFSDFDCFHIK